MDYERFLSEIYSKNQVKLGLDNILSCLADLGNPHLTTKVIHIAGTNGKGSTATMISSILTAAGKKTGKFLSPFIDDLRESITINGTWISKDEMLRLYEKIRSYDLTYFEIKTVIAFLYFDYNNVDYAVIETGLGGRLDATNVTRPILSVITNIALEHTDKLGDTIAEITKEKSGIIKDAPVITSATGIALEIIKQICQEKNLNCITSTKEAQTSLEGDFQKKNAGLAAEAIRNLNALHYTNISEEILHEGLIQSFIPGRFEKKGSIVLDCAHNPAAIRELVSYCKKIGRTNNITVLSIMKDKNYKEMIQLLDEITSKYIFTSIDMPRCADPKILQESTTKDSEISKEPKILKNEEILVTGSCYLVSKIRTTLE